MLSTQLVFRKQAVEDGFDFDRRGRAAYFQQKAYRYVGYIEGEFSVSERVAATLLSLPGAW